MSGPKSSNYRLQLQIQRQLEEERRKKEAEERLKVELNLNIKDALRKLNDIKNQAINDTTNLANDLGKMQYTSIFFEKIASIRDNIVSEVEQLPTEYDRGQIKAMNAYLNKLNNLINKLNNIIENEFRQTIQYAQKEIEDEKLNRNEAEFKEKTQSFSVEEVKKIQIYQKPQKTDVINNQEMLEQKYREITNILKPYMDNNFFTKKIEITRLNKSISEIFHDANLDINYKIQQLEIR